MRPIPIPEIANRAKSPPPIRPTSPEISKSPPKPKAVATKYSPERSKSPEIIRVDKKEKEKLEKRQKKDLKEREKVQKEWEQKRKEHREKENKEQKGKENKEQKEKENKEQKGKESKEKQKEREQKGKEKYQVPAPRTPRSHIGQIPDFNIGRTDELPLLQEEEERVECPMCLKMLPKRDDIVNAHIDECLTKQILREEAKERDKKSNRLTVDDIDALMMLSNKGPSSTQSAPVSSPIAIAEPIWQEISEPKQMNHIQTDHYAFAFELRPWFYSNIDRRETETILFRSTEDTFLVRKSQTMKDGFVVSIYSYKRQAVAHKLVYKKDSGYSFEISNDKRIFRTLEELVNESSETKGLKTPPPQSVQNT